MSNDTSAAGKSSPGNLPPEGLSGILHAKPIVTETTPDSSAAFGCMEGGRDQAAAVAFRLRNGNVTWFSYGWLGTWQFNPSEGLLLKFSGDLVYLVLVRGTNLDRPLKQGAVSLTQGLQDHRVLWLREMSKEETATKQEAGPIIDRIEVAQFESQDAIKEWLAKNAPAFKQ